MTFRPNVVYPPGVLDCRGSDRSRVLGDALTHPGLVVIAGPRGSGKTARVRAAGVPLLAARALAPLRHRAGLPLARAIRTAIPVDDVALAAEAVRIRLGGRALLVEDVQHADAYTLAVLASVAPAVPIVVTLRTPSPLADRLRAVSRLWLDLPPPPAAVGSSVRTLVGMPVPARTALAALGLLGRPAAAGLLGPGVDWLLHAGLAELAAGVLAPAERRALHRRLGAALTDGVEAARHLLAAGTPAAAAAKAEAAAATAQTPRERAAALLVAVTADPALALPAAAACGSAGLAGEALRLLSGPVTNGPTTRVAAAALRAAALVDLGHHDDAAAELRAVDADVPVAPPAVANLHAVASIRAAVATDPQVACTLAEFAVAAAGADAPPALLAAHATALRAAGREDWESAARAALDAAAAAGDRVAERLAGAALVAELREAAAADGAYSAELQFRADGLWAGMHADGALDEALRSAGALLDRTVPADARALLVATLALARADTGALPAARGLLERAGPVAADRTVRWVAAETSWLAGEAEAARDAA